MYKESQGRSKKLNKNFILCKKKTNNNKNTKCVK